MNIKSRNLPMTKPYFDQNAANLQAKYKIKVSLCFEAPTNSVSGAPNTPPIPTRAFPSDCNIKSNCTFGSAQYEGQEPL